MTTETGSLIKVGDTFSVGLFSAHCGIYAIVNTKTGRAYIGQSTDILGRWRGHYYALINGKHSSRALLKDWHECGSDSFEFRVIEMCDSDQLDQREKHWIDTWEPKPYNQSEWTPAYTFSPKPEPIKKPAKKKPVEVKPKAIQENGQGSIWMSKEEYETRFFRNKNYRCNFGQGVKEYTYDELIEAIEEHSLKTGEEFVPYASVLYLVEGIIPKAHVLYDKVGFAGLDDEGKAKSIHVDVFNQVASAYGVEIINLVNP